MADRLQTRRQPRLLPLAVLAAMACGHSGAQACRCPAEPGPATAYARADAVLLAEVLRVEPSVEPGVEPVRGPVSGPVSGPAATGSTRPDPGEQRAWVRVSQAWKHAAGSELWVYTRTTCAYPWVPGQTVLLHTFEDRQRGQVHTRQCMGNQPLDQARARLNWLQRHGRAANVQAVSPAAGPAASR